MYSQKPWRQELTFVISLLAFLAALGSLSGFSYWLAIIAMILWAAWHFYNLWCLLSWLNDANQSLPMDAPGLWGHVYYRLQMGKNKEKKRKKQIRRLLKEFSTSTQAMPDAAVVLNHRYEIQWVNDAATKIIGLKRSDTGQPITDLLRQPKFYDWLNDHRDDESFHLESPLDIASTLLLRVVPYGQNQYLLVARDITERKRLDQMRQDFIANASHELRTPLTVLQGSLELLQDKLQSDPEFEKPLVWMARQSDRMQSILNDLLVLARLENQANDLDSLTTTVDVAELIHLQLDEAKILSDKLGGHQWKIEVETGKPILGNNEHLQIVISNLVINAVRYTPSGGTITVRWQYGINGVRFCVQDTGPGIAIHHLHRLTERFYRVDVSRSRESGGTGLGLAIVKHVLEGYGAMLNIRSTTGYGSTFCFDIAGEYLKE